MKELSIKEIVYKLIGPISPVGETNQDEIRLENIEEFIELFDSMTFILMEISENSKRVEFSMKEIGEKAKQCLMETKEYIDDYI